jgi:hypothetical protein
MFFVTLIGLSDVIVYFYRQSDVASVQDPISYPAHISGAAVGLLAGITCLKNLRWETFERFIWAASACVCLVIIATPAIFTLTNPAYFEEPVRYLNFTLSCIVGAEII